MDKPKVTPKDFFLWIGAMITLYASIFSLISLLFDYIDYAFPDALDQYVDPYSGSMRYAIASLIVLAPAFLILMRLIRNDIIRSAEKRELWIRRWALFLTVFIAGSAVIIDLITLINYFLGGELTTHFILKVLVVLLVAGGGLLHFLADIRGYWLQYPQRVKALWWAAGAVIVATIAAGFFIIGSPNEVRLFRFDDQKVSDLQNIQYQVVNYWQSKEKLPSALADLNDSINGYVPPTDPQSGAQYVYQATGALSFKLCATFNAVTQPHSPASRATPMAPVPIGGAGKPIADNWQHGAGQVCFDRTIDPQRYPPYPKQKPQ